MKRMTALLLAVLAALTIPAAAAARGLSSVSVSPSPGSFITLTYQPSSHYSSSVYYSNIREVVLSGNQRLDLVNAALSQVGYHEGNSFSQLTGSNSSGSMNYTEYGYWYGRSVLGHDTGFFYEWCAMFTAWSARQARIPTSVINNASYAHAGSNPFYFNMTYHRSGTYVPKPGDLIFYDWAFNNKQWDHVGIVAFVENGRVHTVEGNASDQVLMRDISINNYEIQGYGEPAYTNADASALDVSKYTAPSGSISVGSSGSGVRWLQAALLHLGYPTPVDGNFGYNTQRQLKRFQSFCGLASDGVCGQNTVNAIKARLKAGSGNSADPSTYPVPTRTLRQGCTGSDVKWLQAALKKLGADITIDGNFGPATREKVVWAQNRLGLSKDGVCGPATRSRLIKATGSQQEPTGGSGADPSGYPVPTRTLKQTMSGDDVKWLQAALRKYGFTMSITGYFGTNTRANLVKFQQREGLEADGVCGVNTLKKLKEFLKIGASPQGPGYPEPARVLKEGCTGGDVKWLQTALKRLGYAVTVDGVFGSGTEAQLIAFQRAAGIAADGICGSETRKTIKSRLGW
ncbi:MAG: peptidoglycan-binding protein [Clostridiales bacterium]|nr:peptidoglycan-binding protein [Clostridiales bacterium]